MKWQPQDRSWTALCVDRFNKRVIATLTCVISVSKPSSLRDYEESGGPMKILVTWCNNQQSPEDRYQQKKQWVCGLQSLKYGFSCREATNLKTWTHETHLWNVSTMFRIKCEIWSQSPSLFLSYGSESWREKCGWPLTFWIKKKKWPHFLSQTFVWNVVWVVLVHEFLSDVLWHHSDLWPSTTKF